MKTQIEVHANDDMKSITLISENGNTLKITNEDAIDFFTASKQKLNLSGIVRPEGDFKKALGLLRDLADIQNGPPLVTYEKEWNEIINNVYAFLKENESAGGEPLPAEGEAQSGSGCPKCGGQDVTTRYDVEQCFDCGWPT